MGGPSRVERLRWGGQGGSGVGGVAAGAAAAGAEPCFSTRPAPEIRLVTHKDGLGPTGPQQHARAHRLLAMSPLTRHVAARPVRNTAALSRSPSILGSLASCLPAAHRTSGGLAAATRPGRGPACCPARGRRADVSEAADVCIATQFETGDPGPGVEGSANHPRPTLTQLEEFARRTQRSSEYQD